jgi:glycosyltransferase involved in cell wall biosynthesis
VTDVGGLAEIVPDGKVGYVTPVDEEAIAAGILDFFREDRAAKFRENILSERKRFSWDAMRESIFKLASEIP